MSSAKEPVDLPPHGEPRASAMIVCRSCERRMPADLSFCPHCCGDDGRRGACLRGAFVGGVFGMLGGGLASAVWSSMTGLETTAWMPVLLVVLAVTVVGMAAGAIAGRKG